MSSDCVNYMSGHIDTKYLDQAFWIYDRMAASQRLKLSRPQQWNRPEDNISLMSHLLSTEDSISLMSHLLSTEDSISLMCH